MPMNENIWWVTVVFLIISTACIAAIFIRNKAAKSDSVGRSEKDTVATNVSIEPRKNTRKLD